ncbi:venom protease-like [Galendromus occidentalis]|uniref:Acrosin n=1 Tax=Galendromus occidentalis TaxID=34638 RepID=A0AAJ6QWB9_9ACAR|nr:venom protease-like [Galendromus occidentalis]
MSDELPREEATTPQSNIDAANSLADASPRFPRKWYHGDEDDSDEDDAGLQLDGGCGEDLSCRTSHHCAALGGKPTFMSCGASPGLYCCDLSRNADPLDEPRNGTVKSDSQCGWNREKTNRIIGGYDTEFGEIPWQAFVKIDGIRCGGALVDRRHVVTAAHCVVGRKTSKIEVLLGELVLKRFVEELPHERRRVADVIIHPDYENLNVDSYDVAILVLDKPVEYQANIMPICLPQPNQSFLGKLATVSGWGRVFPDHEVRSNHLQSIQVPIIGNGLCRKWLRSRGKYAGINADHVCAGYEAGGRDSCRGDSGGPLTYQMKGRWYLVGIVSAGFGCGKPRQPGIYHRVSHSAEWISEQVFS